MIANLAHPDDLANLRLVRKWLNIAAIQPFGMSFFAHRRFIVPPYSL